ncbi:MAG: universal stress protein [Planctomycetota bacterium]
MSKKILLPVGDAALARAVVDHVEPLLRCQGAEATFFHVAPPGPGAEPARRADLDALVADLRGRGVSASAALIEGVDPADAIVERGRALDAWLIVMATRGRRDEVAALGSVTARVLRHARGTLLLFNPWALTSRFRRILVPLDGSEVASRVLPRVEELAQVYGAEVLLARVVPPDAALETWQAVRAELEATRAELELAGVEAHALALPGTDVAGTLLGAVGQRSVDVIAMTSHGRGGLETWPFGSVAEKVFASAPVPLLLRRVVELSDPAPLLDDLLDGEPPAEPAEAPPPSALRPTFPESLLVPLDGSDLARRVLLLLPVLLGERKARVVLLGVEGPGSHGARERLEAVAGGVRWRGLDAEVRVERGDAARQIVTAAREADLVLMSSHGRSGLGRFLRGSVAERVLRASPAPVLTVNPAGLAEVSGPEDRFRRILVPHDGSARARRVLPLVAGIAWLHGAQVVLLRALERDPQEPHAALAAERERQEAELEPDRAALAALGVSAVIESATGPAIEEVVAAAGAADLVALGTHGRSGPARWLLGSVTEAVLRRCARPLLVVR